MMQRWTIIICSVFLVSNAILGQISTTKHNLSATSGNTIVADSETGVCIFCHTAHSTETIDQLWNKTLTEETNYTLYSSSRLSGYPTPSQPNAKSKLCMSCHDGTIAIGSVYNTPGSGTTGTITMAGGVTTMPVAAAGHIGVNLADDHPIGYTYDPGSDPDLITKAWPWADAGETVLLDPDASNGTVECHTCHDAHDNTYPPFLHQDKATLCNECHSKPGWETAVHQTVGCGGCHIPHGGGNSLLGGVEEAACYNSGCHGTTSPASGTTSLRLLDVESQLGYTNSHPTNIVSGAHSAGTGDDMSSSNRHAECFDCHDPHLAGGSSASGIATALKGVWGVEPISWPTPIVNTTNNDNEFSAPVSYTTVEPAEYEYQVCLKCHSNYTTLPAGAKNIAEEINPKYRSTHGLVNRTVLDGSDGTEPRNPFVNASNMNAPFDEDPATYTRTVLCSDCHASDIGVNTIETRTDAKGPHGSNVTVGSLDPLSNQNAMLIATIASNDVDGTPLCNVCHSRSNYWDGSLVSSRYSQHPSVKGAHQFPTGCFTCHMYDYSEYGSFAGTGGPTGGHSEVIFVHGQNKTYNLGEYNQGSRNNPAVGAGQGQVADAFVNGFIADMDFNGLQCWSEADAAGCGRSHSGQGY